MTHCQAAPQSRRPAGETFDYLAMLSNAAGMGIRCACCLATGSWPSRLGQGAGTRAVYLLGGLVSVAFGVVLFARPGVGAITLALLFGLFNLVYGAWQFVLSIELRQTDKTLRSVVANKHPHKVAA